MKNVAFLLFILLNSYEAIAQNPVLERYGNLNYGETRGAYYKDTRNFLNQFEGTWLYSDNGTILKIILKKKERFHENGDIVNFYTDYIVGEYQYIKDGIEIQNTLSNLNINYSEIFKYNIYGNIGAKKVKSPSACPECQSGERRLLTFYTEPSRRNVEGLDSQMVFRRFTENGVTKLKVWFYGTSSSFGFTTDGQRTDIASYLLPYGEYVLTKQP